jgi:heme oxygenase
MTVPMLRGVLREGTRDLHARIEEQMAIEQRVRDRAAYVELLKGFHGFYVPVETKLCAFVPAFRASGIDLAERMKSVKLASDLHALGEHTLEHCDDDMALVIDTFPRAVGCLYVLEGSTLGGQVIQRHIKAALGFDAASGAAFFSGYGSQTGAMWQSFLRFLTALPFGQEGIVAAVAAARDTFEALERRLCAPA